MEQSTAATSQSSPDVNTDDIKAEFLTLLNTYLPSNHKLP